MAPRASAVAPTKHSGLRGLGLRRGLLAALESEALPVADFLEFTPENWMGFGPALQGRLRSIAERYPCRTHGLSLDLGGVRPLDDSLLRELKVFLDAFGIDQHSDHLSFCADQGHLYELLPLPFTAEAVRHVAARIHKASERLERRLAIENASRYVNPGGDLTELEFLCAVLEEADCDLLLDVNNVYVNSVNHGFDPHAFIRALPSERIAWGHIAGHVVRMPGRLEGQLAAGTWEATAAADGIVLIDTHGAQVRDDVWALLETAYASHGEFPVVLERDANLPGLAELVAESRGIEECAARTQAKAAGLKLSSATRRRTLSVPLPKGLGPGFRERPREASAPLAEFRERAVADPSSSVAQGAALTSPTLVETLESFAAAVRDPALAVPPGIDPQGFALYRELAGDNLEALLNRVFPVLRACVGDASWRDLRTGFLRDFRATTPYFPKVGGEFVRYLETLPVEPWWLELADWEWLEVEVRHAAAEPGAERVNPTLHLRHVKHAVHLLRADIPSVPAGTAHWLAVYRGAADTVRFAELTPVTVRLLQCLQASADGDEDELLRGLAEELHWPDLVQFQQAGREMIASLASMEILSRPG